ncbi:homogentisate 1,2-dioxygenase [Candidatus Obscuribacterales bacterium]|nr:homogentisate 1,2-dioxygenase [Candidatus Obscuribacterales bacterium]
MPIYQRSGNVPAKRHVQFRNGSGKLYQEEVFGSRGFDGRYSILYHLYAPTEVRELEVLKANEQPKLVPSSEGFRHRHFRLGDATTFGDAVSGRKVCLVNSDVSIGICAPEDDMEYFYCNGNSDELIFVQEGAGVLHTQFGNLPYKEGDYIVVPKGTIYKMTSATPKADLFLVIETPGNLELPRRYLNEYGQLLEHSPFYSRDILIPENTQPEDKRGDFEVRVKTRSHLMSYHLGHHPFDVVGWDGYLYPFIFNIFDFEPITGRIHMPPPVHQTFAGQNFVVCSFVPRLVDYHPDAIPAPYNHSNLQSDEVLFYVSGNFMSRKGINEGSMTFHPAGIPHGPQPDAMQESIGMTRTTETAVMIDTFQPLNVTMDALDFDDKKYSLSWGTTGDVPSKMGA